MSAYVPAKRATMLDLLANWRAAAAVTALVVLGAAAWSLNSWIPILMGGRASTLTLLKSGSEHADVVLSAARAERKYEFVSVIGTVSNVSGRDLKDVEAVVELLDRDGKLLSVDSALLGVSALSTGAETPFKLAMRDADGASTYRVRFRSFLGAPIPSRSE